MENWSLISHLDKVDATKTGATLKKEICRANLFLFKRHASQMQSGCSSHDVYPSIRFKIRKYHLKNIKGSFNKFNNSTESVGYIRY